MIFGADTKVYIILCLFAYTRNLKNTLGAPNDEYDYESRTISEMLRSNMDVYQISSIIANVMESSFSHPYDTSFFVEIASKIKAEMQEEQIES